MFATPGNVAAMVAKALTLPVDVLMLDLEDGVPNGDDSKQRARRHRRCAAFACRRRAARDLGLVNGPRTRWSVKTSPS
ncbi:MULTISPECIES: aldolase/citrate lyase family protein [unclassified Variovorax]|uniref:aldolase/citrate lyase family protein n=1 Tax=unclassified Variovorax TaxID=663243 RepID=UPI00076CA5F7|nr:MULTISPECIES: aldolase/citrate lyase family protein [unclassified Variovorax]KWT89583.1 hypothetical protein APY03_3368 [Variovorax sp. WDL1]PNG51809.1 hypothetical protein CHC06_04931 [Variovorax sp. B2]PNG54156.1 hypothetical protein CHC07_03980 [Variovorax sp. B4]VTV11638.1 hypothetical protein WDL1CHR_02499 [Variovorax sp. WDL1]